MEDVFVGTEIDVVLKRPSFDEISNPVVPAVAKRPRRTELAVEDVFVGAEMDVVLKRPSFDEIANPVVPLVAKRQRRTELAILAVPASVNEGADFGVRKRPAAKPDDVPVVPKRAKNKNPPPVADVVDKPLRRTRNQSNRAPPNPPDPYVAAPIPLPNLPNTPVESDQNLPPNNYYHEKEYVEHWVKAIEEFKKSFNVKECDECREDFHDVYFRNTLTQHAYVAYVVKISVQFHLSAKKFNAFW
jgi:hypothetical protein